MEFNPQQIQEQVRGFVRDLIGDKLEPPVAQKVEAAKAGGTEIHVSASGDVVIRVNCGASPDVEPEPETASCYIVENHALIQSLQFSDAEEKLLSRIMQASGVSRTALLQRLLERAIAREARTYAAEEFGISD